MTKVVVSVFMDEELKQKLKVIADKDQRSVSQMAAILLDEAIKARENKS